MSAREAMTAASPSSSGSGSHPYVGVEDGADRPPQLHQQHDADPAEHAEPLHQRLAGWWLAGGRPFAPHQSGERRGVELFDELLVVQRYPRQADQRVCAGVAGAQHVEGEHLEQRREQHPGVDLVGHGRLDEGDDRFDLSLDVGHDHRQGRLVDVLLGGELLDSGPPGVVLGRRRGRIFRVEPEVAA